MESPHSRHRIVGSGAVFERGGAFDEMMWRWCKIDFDAAMVGGTVATGDGHVEPCEAAIENSQLCLVPRPQQR